MAANAPNVRDPMRERDIIVGVISDTHGLLRPQAVAALAGSDMIIHAGDVGTPEVIDRLGGVAPTFVVRGNVDTAGWAARLPLTLIVEVAALRVFVLHEISQLDLDLAAAGFAAVVFGHSHRPSIETRRGVLFLNPGSAGPRRFNLPVTVARVRVSGRRMRPEIIELQV
jgi:putative phosphoesterase